jgi:hypothetical protein
MIRQAVSLSGKEDSRGAANAPMMKIYASPILYLLLENPIVFSIM